MVTDVTLIRDPSEEKEALQAFAKKLKEYKTIVTFNGTSFDLPYLHERFLAHCLPVRSFPQQHIDLYPIYKSHVRDGHGFPQAKLQTYERTELDFRRKGDIHGEKIPSVYWNMVFGKDSSQVPTVIHHNQLDLVTMTIMYQQLCGVPSGR